MIERLTKVIAWAKRFEDQRGQALREFSLCLPPLLLLAFGVIDFSQMIVDEHVLVGLSRQGSNLAARSETPAATVAAIETQGASLNIGTRGMIIVTQVVNNSSGSPIIHLQSQMPGGISVTSAVGSGNGNPAIVPPGAQAELNTGHAVFVTEVFYSYQPLTPVGSFLKYSLANTLYQAAYF